VKAGDLSRAVAAALALWLLRASAAVSDGYRFDVGDFSLKTVTSRFGRRASVCRSPVV
jgi:hypothetical protein